MTILTKSPYLGHIITTEIIVWGICIGVSIAFLLYFLSKRVVGSLVRAILDQGLGENNAIEIDKINKNNWFYKFLLRDKSTLRNIVFLVGDKLPKDENGKVSFTGAKFYIDEKNKEKAEKTYGSDMKIITLIGLIFLCIAVGVGMHFALPFILNLIPIK